MKPDKETIKTILGTTVIIFIVLLINFLIYKNTLSKKTTIANQEENQQQQTLPESSLNPKKVVENYIKDNLANTTVYNVNSYGTIRPNTPSNELDNYEIGAYFNIISKYEIIEENQPENNNVHYIKVNFYCDKILSNRPTGLKTEQLIKTPTP